MRIRVWVVVFLPVALLLLAACGSSVDPAPPSSAPTPTSAAAAYLTPEPAIAPIDFPEDEAPHEMLTEWWYYTGHLFTADGTRYGFEYVIFQARRGAFPPYFAGHFAITNSAADEFTYAEKFGIDAALPTDAGFSFDLDGWTMRGALGEDALSATMDRYAIDLQLSSTKPPAFHDGNGYVEFGPSGGSYYYSRTRIDVSGTLTVDGEPLPVTGEAWFDHQWGNFITVGAGGWDWFSVQLDDGSDLTISLVRNDDGSLATAYGTVVAPDGTQRNLTAADIAVTTEATWTSSDTGTTWPAGWTITLPNDGWTLTVTPTMADQELQTLASTDTIYWEGEVRIDGTANGAPATGLGYVELTGYANGLPIQLGQ
ncbi:MAG TPA: lipocalin family protein [Thermomicrobiales bacterium]|nr:lipocalin family protein [Thermomicrobiales bacterium]